jgi:hypothetical protein
VHSPGNSLSHSASRPIRAPKHVSSRNSGI